MTFNFIHELMTPVDNITAGIGDIGKGLGSGFGGLGRGLGSAFNGIGKGLGSLLNSPLLIMMLIAGGVIIVSKM